MTGLYLHIPFCVSPCRYCDFYKVTTQQESERTRFLDALMVELKRLPKAFAPDTVFIGGGTPTVLSVAELERLLNGLHETVNLSRVVEFSCEANPGTLTPDKLRVLREGGINRVSIGVQSFHDDALRLLGRIHKGQEAIEGFELLRAAGFDNVNIDLIQSIPNMSMEATLADVRQVVALAPEHISNYNLIYEPGTPLTHDLESGRVATPDEDLEADVYVAVKDALGAAGFEHYEISNFCRAGKPCLHNVLYWQGGEYLGCGPSAHSHWQGGRFGNVSDLGVYTQRLSTGVRPFDFVERLDAEAKARELLVMQLRMLEGVDCATFQLTTGFSVETLCGEVLSLFEQERLLERRGGRLRLTEAALFVSNAVFSELV